MNERAPAAGALRYGWAVAVGAAIGVVIAAGVLYLVNVLAGRPEPMVSVAAEPPGRAIPLSPMPVAATPPVYSPTTPPVPPTPEPLGPPAVEPPAADFPTPAVSSPEPAAGGAGEAPRGTICVDPGHPSETSDGCQAADGTSENHINWVVGQALRRILTDRGHRVVMTKSSENQRVTNRRRAEIANEALADLMIRLHCDTGGGRGFTFYYPDRPGTKDGVTGPPQAICDESGVVSTCLHAALATRLAGQLRDNGIKTDRQTAVGARQGALTGSIYARVPTVTIEMVFLSDAQDTAWIKSPANQERMALALTDGIERYLKAKAGG